MDEQQYEYRTGRTDPDKNSRGLVTFLLICIIFLGGLVSVLSFLNIHLFRVLKSTRQETAPLSFSQGEATLSASDSLVVAGMALQEPDPVYQQLHDLPQGLFVAQVEPGSQAAALGIAPGDVLVSYNGTAVSTLAALKELQKGQGNAVPIVLSRDGQTLSMTITQ